MRSFLLLSVFIVGAVSAANNLRTRELSSHGRCSSSQRCVELRSSPSTRYQAYPDGHCQRFDRCAGSDPNCACQSNPTPRETNYIFEQTSDRRDIEASYPFLLPGFSIDRFVDGPGTQFYRINDGQALADFAFSLKNDSLEGNLVLRRDIPTVQGVGLLTNLDFGFRVTESGIYSLQSNFTNYELSERNTWDISIEDRDFHPNGGPGLRFSADFNRDNTETTVELEAGHDYLIRVNGHTSGTRTNNENSNTTLEGPSTAMMWTLSPMA